MYHYERLNRFCFFLFYFVGFLISYTYSEKDITITIAPKSEQCFYESLKPGEVIDIDYQVIDGVQGYYDISFYLMSPSDRTIVMDFRKTEKAHRIEVDEEGDYKFCFDNRYSTIKTRTVYFELIIEAEDGSDMDMWDVVSAKPSPEDQYEVAIKDIEESVKRVKSHLLKIRHFQEASRIFAARDKFMLEKNLFRVSSWSIIQILVMIFVGLIQFLGLAHLSIAQAATLLLQLSRSAIRWVSSFKRAQLDSSKSLPLNLGQNNSRVS